jgi:hypothetical protein
MNEWLNAQADGIALAFWFALAGLAILIVAAFIERRLRPRHEREFPHLTTVDKYRQRERDEYSFRRSL